jgi:Trypsin-like peptidase domain
VQVRQLHRSNSSVYTGSGLRNPKKHNATRDCGLIDLQSVFSREAKVKSVFSFFRKYVTARMGFALALDLILVTLGRAQSPVPQAQKPYNPCLAAGIKKTVVFLGVRMSNPQKSTETISQFTGTGFLIFYDTVNYLVTAKHVVHGIRDVEKENNTSRGAFFWNRENGKSSYALLDEHKKRFSVDWIMSPIDDVSMIPFAIRQDYDVRTIPDSMFLESDNLLELQDVFFVSYQPGIGDTNRITPITRHGTVSVVNNDRTFYLDGFGFPGNSGSPVFIRPSSVSVMTKDAFTLGDPLGCKFVGVVGEYLPYQEVAVSTQTRRARVLFEENTGLARVWPVQSIKRLFSDSNFVAQHQRLRKKSPPSTDK